MEVNALKMDIPVQNNTATRLTNSQTSTDKVGSQNGESINTDKAVNEAVSSVSENAKNNAAGDNNKPTENEVPVSSLEKAIDNANKALVATGRQLKYSVHEKTHKIMVSVIDSGTKEVIKEIPPEKVLDTYAKMLELAGLLFDEKS